MIPPNNGPLLLQGDKYVPANGWNPPLASPNVPANNGPLVMRGDQVQPAGGWPGGGKAPAASPESTTPGTADLGRVAPLVTMSAREQKAFDNPYTRNDPGAWTNPVRQTPSGFADGPLFMYGGTGTASATRTTTAPPTRGTMSAPVAQSAITNGNASGFAPGFLTAVAHVESDGVPTAHSPGSQYKGLYQLSTDEWAKYGSGDIYNADDNTKAATKLWTDLSGQFQAKYGRAPTSAELYLVHQQGFAGAAAHIANPTGIAWQNVKKFYPGKSDNYVRSAIWGNMTPAMKQQFPGGVDTVTSGDFMKMWADRLAGFGAGPSPFAGARSV